ncbi:MAG: pyruvate dehydrogenase complex dihydrolipoamide acetyltransferase [Micavibrio sp.]|nr:pyruvate dehydrogenase complex dihydrolipoamide acetyltransferase [Micavibrio sp.]|tara:strand:- start:350620 stop:351936 length:1317 start_codon:yes stop_codon:yes gene_type:complete
MPIKITMPALSPTMEEGTLAKWLVSEGDEVNAGDVIAEIETDKATMEVEAVDEGVLGKIIVAGGTENVKVNDVIGVLLEEGEDKSAIESMDLSSGVSKPEEKPEAKAESKSEPKEQKQEKAEPVSAQAQQKSEAQGDRIFASPLARRLAKDKNIDLSSVSGSGPRGRIVKADIENFKGGSASKGVQTSSSNANKQMPAGQDAQKLANVYGMEYEAIPNNNIKKITAQRLLESKLTVPHFYLTIDCQIDTLLAARKDINEQANGEYKLSVNDFVVKAVAMALKAYPAANVSWSDEAVLQYTHADISVAVSTPNGLITPIVKAAETKGMREISAEIKDLAGRAREGKLKPEEFQGGTFSVSNLGMFGISEFGAIINPPQACILAVGAGEQRPYVKNGEVKIGTFMKCTLSVDHRAVDGAVGAEYLQYFKRFIENPVSMIV